ncbi:unnamed protein product, partial [Prorocentrum cordatum]
MAVAKPNVPVTLTVSVDLVGMLIGKGGETVRQLSRDDSGARIEVSKMPDGGAAGPVVCSGWG